MSLRETALVFKGKKFKYPLKKRVNVFLDKALVFWAKENNINLSATFNELLKNKKGD